MRHGVGWLLMGAILIGLTIPVRAATITVNAAASGSYQSLTDAFDHYDDWAYDTDEREDPYIVPDTILVYDDAPVYFDDDIMVSTYGGPLTLKPADGEKPLFIVRQERGMFFWWGQFTIEGITIIPDMTHDDAGAFAVCPSFNPTYSDPTITIRDCIVTANDGNDRPVLDWSRPLPDQARRMRRAIYHGDDTPDSPSRRAIIIVDNSVFAFCGPDGASINVGRITQGGLDLQIINSMIVGGQCPGVRLYGRMEGATDTNASSLLIRNSFFMNDGQAVIYGTSGEIAFTGSTTIEDSVLVNPVGSPVSAMNGIGGPLRIERSTISGSPSHPAVLIESADTAPGNQGKYTFIDSIFTSLDLALQFKPSGDPPYESLEVRNLAIVPAGAAYEAAAPAAQKAAFDALFDGQGPLGEDPQFLSTELEPSIDGQGRWDSAANRLFDVSNPAYKGKASDGGWLRGGAQSFEPPDPTSADPRGWTFYE